MTEMLLLGAGASREASIPTAFEMTKEISKRFRTSLYHARHGHVISYVLGGLLFEAGAKNRDPLAGEVNVEDLFNAIQLLANRKNLEASPFIGSWHSMVDVFDQEQPSSFDARRLVQAIYEQVAGRISNAFNSTPAGFERSGIDSALTEFVNGVVRSAVQKHHHGGGYRIGVGQAVEDYVKRAGENWSSRLQRTSPSGSSEINRELERLVDSRQSEPGDGSVFHRTNELMIAELKKITWVDDPSRVKHLKPIVRLLQKQNRLAIATLNYDNSIEVLAGSDGVDCKTGIAEWSQSGEVSYPESGICLLKLHGSIDWVRQSDPPTNEGRMSHVGFRQASKEEVEKSNFRPAVIFGQRNKLTAEGPFLDLLRAFREELMKADVLTVVGYSFADEHVNVFISNWLNTNPQHRIQIINGPGFESSPNDYVSQLIQLRRKDNSRVTILANNAGDGLASLYPE